MMYDAPKAAHFKAFIRGKPLPDNEPTGLNYRWCMASRVIQAGIGNMIGLSSDNHRAIQRICDSCNAGRVVKVELRVDPERDAAEQEAAVELALDCADHLETHPPVAKRHDGLIALAREVRSLRAIDRMPENSLTHKTY